MDKQIDEMKSQLAMKKELCKKCDRMECGHCAEPKFRLEEAIERLEAKKREESSIKMVLPKKKKAAPIAEKKPRAKKAAQMIEQAQPKVIEQPKPVPRAQPKAQKKPELRQPLLFVARDLSGAQLGLFGDERLFSLD
jgi:hypothetical protein